MNTTNEKQGFFFYSIDFYYLPGRNYCSYSKHTYQRYKCIVYLYARASFVCVLLRFKSTAILTFTSFFFSSYGKSFDTFSFLLNDGQEFSTHNSSVTIDVVFVNDPPVAISAVVGLDEDTEVWIQLNATDVDPHDNPTIHLQTLPTKGSLYTTCV